MATKRKSERLASVAAAAANKTSTPNVTVLPAAKKTKPAPPPAKKKKTTTVETDLGEDKKKRKSAGKRTIPEKKKQKIAVAEIEEAESGPDPSEESADSNNGSVDEVSMDSKSIVVEYCKQCQQFKKRAFLVRDGLEKAHPNIKVLLNPDKPRRGCFEVRVEGGEVYISLLDMKRPFQKMKDLDMEKVVADIVKKAGEL